MRSFNPITINRSIMIRFVAAGVLALAAAFAAPQAHAQCTLSKKDLPSTGYLRFIGIRDGRVVYMQKGIYNSSNIGHVWEQQGYVGYGFIPFDYLDLQVRHEGRYVYETWLGKVRLVYKQIPVVKFCSARWSVARI